MKAKNIKTTQAEFQKTIIKKYFNIDVDTSGMREREDKRLIVIPIGMTEDKAYNALPFEKNKSENNLDKSISKNDRVADKTYAIYVDNVVEADEKFKKKSAKNLKKNDHKGVTLIERLLDELYFFENTGKHLDIDNVTLCSGSRHVDGDIPAVFYCGTKLRVFFIAESSSGNDLRSREVVSA